METSATEEKKITTTTEPPAPVEKTVTLGTISTPNNPWFQIPNSRINTPAVIKASAAAPIRSISTFNFMEVKENISPAAPFPSIPTKQEVQKCKSDVEAEIERLKTELASLQYERKSLDAQIKNPTLEPGAETQNGIHVFRGLIMTDNVISDIIKDNMKKSRISQDRALVEPCTDVPNACSALHKLPKYRHIVDLPQFKKTIDQNKELLTPIYAAKFGEKETILEKEEELAMEYNEYDAPWQKNQKIIDEYNNRTSEKNENWPNEFKFERPKLDDAACLKWTAQDQPMILSKQQRLNRCYYDTNSLVQDPIGEFKDYKKRLIWTEEEKKIFLEKYAQHPKNFGGIADSLPEKDIKEVIEFYYLNRYKLNLKESEGAAKKRGGKKKVVSEGSKKNF